MDPRAYFRLDIWRSASQMIAAQPIWGFGPGTFGEVYPFYRPGWLWNTTTPFAHNEYLQVAAECGLPVLLLTLLFLAETVRRSLTAFFSFPVFQKVPAKVRAAEVAFYLVVFEALHCLVDFTFHEWSHRLVLLGFVTYAWGGKKDGEDLSVSIGLSRLAAGLGTATAILLCLWMLGAGALKDYLAKVYNAKSVVLLQKGELDAAEANALKSLAFRPRYSDPWNSLGVIEYGRGSFSKGWAEREKHFNAAKDDYGMAMQLSPYSATPQENEVENMVRQGRLREALDLQKELIAKIPEAPTYRLDLGRILARMGRFPEALAAFEKAIDIDGYYLPAYLSKAQALEALGKKGEALKTYEQMKDLLQKLGLKDPSGQIEAGIQKLKSGR
jgi:tetratricopeptide (TPR) repeat protein